MADNLAYAVILLSIAGGFSYSVMIILAIIRGIFNACKIWINVDE